MGIEKSLKVRFSEAADSRQIYDFYNSNRHEHVDRRKEGVLAERASGGHVFVIETDKQELGTSSIAFDFARHNEEESKVTWKEIGATRSVLSNMGLYPFIIASQVINEFLSSPPTDKILANVHASNTTVGDFLEKKVGWHIFEPEGDILHACHDTKDDERAEGIQRVWLEATSDTLPHQARIVLDYMERGLGEGLENKKTKERYKLDLSEFSLANSLLPMVKELAQGSFGKNLEKSPHEGFEKTREKLVRHMKL